MGGRPEVSTLLNVIQSLIGRSMPESGSWTWLLDILPRGCRSGRYPAGRQTSGNIANCCIHTNANVAFEKARFWESQRKSTAWHFGYLFSAIICYIPYVICCIFNAIVICLCLDNWSLLDHALDTIRVYKQVVRFVYTFSVTKKGELSYVSRWMSPET